MKINRRKILLCACGCKRKIIIKPHHKYIGIPKYVHGHNNCINGKNIISEETRKKISDTLINHIVSEETRKKISDTLKEKYPKGKHPLCGKIVSEETKEKNRLWHLGRKQSEESNIKRSRALKGKIFSKEHNEKISKTRKGMKFTEQHKQNISKKRKLQTITEESKAKQSITMKRKWIEDKSYIKKIYDSRIIKPNKPETLILNLLNQLYPAEWKYTGDFSFIINGKNPDFINVNGQKKIIELFGDYWHDGDDPKDRAKVFKPFGYETLVIWESELKNINKVKNKIIKFNDGV